MHNWLVVTIVDEASAMEFVISLPWSINPRQNISSRDGITSMHQERWVNNSGTATGCQIVIIL